MKRMTVFLMVVIMFGSLTLQLNGFWRVNMIPCTIESIDNCDAVVVEAASNFLQSMSSFYLLMNESELSSLSNFEKFNFEKSRFFLDDVILKLQLAKDGYSVLLAQMTKGSFKQMDILKLRKFDYDKITFKRNLHPTLMKKVKSFLSAADLSGFVKNTQVEIDEILVGLYQVQDSLLNNRIPDLENLRLIYQQLSDSMQVGYYSSLVFSEINK